MCGIVGYIGHRQAADVILDGLHRLEYRGYDSAGVAVLNSRGIECQKDKGKLKVLDELLNSSPMEGTLGIGHTRWATHGVPNRVNAHPHFDCAMKIAVVHNGIVENYAALRRQLTAEGHTFRSETDTEVIAHLVEKYYQGSLPEAVRCALKEVVGSYALGIICRDEPGLMVAARCSSPLIFGIGQNEFFIASDVPAILSYTRKVIYLNEEQVVKVTLDGYEVTDLVGMPVQMPVDTVQFDISAAERGGYPHFMLKEIHEQPQALRNALRGRLSEDRTHVVLEDLPLTSNELARTNKITLIAMGTAWHACMTGKYLIEKFAGIPVEVDNSSEYRYRNPIIRKGDIVIPVTQSGETADTLAGLREAKRKGAKVVSVVNAVGSSIARESHGVLYQHAGPEIGVASTKAYTSQIAMLSLLTMHLGRLKGTVSADESQSFLKELESISDKMQWILDHQETILKCAELYHRAEDFLFLGRSFNYPNALEGALKLKEISYIHAEGYCAGEMKHGPIALVDERLPVVCLCPQSAVYDKMISNMQEIKARNGIVIAVATVGDEQISRHADKVIFVPQSREELSPLLCALPMQLLAYHIAVKRGCDVDQPRNLAKSVTVE